MKHPTTIEATGKKWKAIQAYSGIIVFIGLVAFIGECSLATSEGNHTPIIGLIILGVGLLGGFWGRLGAWWHHR
jgi:hypothetical protein